MYRTASAHAYDWIETLSEEGAVEARVVVTQASKEALELNEQNQEFILVILDRIGFLINLSVWVE